MTKRIKPSTSPADPVSSVTIDDDACAAPDECSAAAKSIKPIKPRNDTKQVTLIAMLRADTGATIAEMMDATGWQSHTVRGAMVGALKKKLGLDVTSEKMDGRGRVYRLPHG